MSTRAHEGHNTELSLEERRLAVWDNLRLVVVDTETTGNRADTHAVSLAAVTVKRGRITGAWSTYLHPGVRISAETTAIHGITDDHVAHEPSFGEVAEQLLSTYAGASGETVVFVAHKVAFDLGVLRAELDRCPDKDGVVRELPDLPVLDTFVPSIHREAGINPKSQSLKDLASALDITNVAAHSATGDAIATAQVAIALIDRAIAQGHSSFDSIHAACGGKRTSTHDVNLNIRRRRTPPTVPAAHLASHARLLPADPSAEQWTQWGHDVRACALAGCPRLSERLHSSAFTREHSHRLLRLATQLAAPDENGQVRSALLNTIAYALGTNIGRAVPTDLTEARQRGEATDLLRKWNAVLGQAKPCGDDGRCPGCAANEECGRDTWWRPLIPALRGPFPDVPQLLPVPTGARAAQNTAIKNQGIAKTQRNQLAKVQRWFQVKPGETAPRLTGVVTNISQHHKAAAAFAAWTIVEWHIAAGRRNEADQVALLALTYGYHDPRTMNWHLSRLSGARRPGDIATALTICDTVLTSRHGSTDRGWLLITARRANLEGINERAVSATLTVPDANGNLVPKRRHHPDNPPRTRALRFARDPHHAQPAQPGQWMLLSEAARAYATTTQQLLLDAKNGKAKVCQVAGVFWVDTSGLAIPTDVGGDVPIAAANSAKPQPGRRKPAAAKVTRTKQTPRPRTVTQRRGRGGSSPGNP